MKEFKFNEISDLRYGENPQQSAGLYFNEEMADYEVLFDKGLSYDNILNLHEVTKVLSEFYDVNAVAITKHAVCCGVALGPTMNDAYNKAFDCDPISAFYGTIGFSQKIDAEIASHINSMGVKVIVAPDFEDEALSILNENANLKIIKLNTSLKDLKHICTQEIRVTPFGVLIQDKNNSELKKDLFKVVTKAKPTKEQVEDAIFAWKIAKYMKTDSAVVAKDFATLGISRGYTNHAAAIESALNYACDATKGAVLATDGAIYSQDAIYAAIQSRIGLIIHPGGSPKDSEIISLADKYELPIIVTGVRNHRY